MAFPPPRTALGSYIDIPFNVSLSIILSLTYACAVRNRGLLLLAVLAVSATIATFDKGSTAGEMTKIMCELPLGLGSVLAFLCASRSTQTRLLPAFTTYVNFAVYGNIGMMVATPADGTLRGKCSKVACAALFLWILQLGHRVGWKTISLRHGDGLFVFTAISKSWVFAHALYRFVLLTLPCFGAGRRHRLMEVYSLALTFALSVTSGLPFEYCFGMADTLVVPTAAAWSAVVRTFDLIPRDTKQESGSQLLETMHIGSNADAYLSMVSLAVAVFALFKIATSGPRLATDATHEQDKRLYGLEHGKLNIVAKPTTMWMNIGFWKDTADFPTACHALLLETLRHARLVERFSDGNETRLVPANDSINILDLGFGCGDQTLCLVDLWRNASLHYVGLTLSHTQYSFARDRLTEARLGGASTAKLHCVDAARPELWSEEIMADTLMLTSPRPQIQSGQELRNKSSPAEATWVLALDTLYHFHPSRLPIVSFAARELRASLMAVDFVRADTASLRQRSLLSVAFSLSGCPRGALMTEAQYREMLVAAGYEPACIEIVDITKHTFRPLSDFMAKQEAELGMMGLTLGKLRFAKGLFAWFARAGVVRAVIVVARRGKQERPFLV